MRTEAKHVVVLGAGFGGLEFCKRFFAPNTRVTLIDRQNHHLFQPLLYQVATAGLSMPEIAQPIRSILSDYPQISVLLNEVSGIDLKQKTIQLKDRVIAYDYLVVALGARTGYFGHDEWAQHTHGLKSLEDAMTIRREILMAYEKAEQEEDPVQREKLLTTVVIGGGPTGVELAGAFAELARHVLKRDFRRIDSARARIFLIEASPKILGTFPDPLPEKGRKQLEDLGVTVKTSSPVQDIGPGWVQLEHEKMEAGNIIWAAGVQAVPVTRQLGVPLDRAGRIQVLPDCSLPGYPEVFAIGDIVALTDPKGVRVPGVSPAAIQMAGHVARILEAEIKDGPQRVEKRPPYTYWDKGSMATIGRTAAIASVGPLKVTGFVAWMLWLFVHLIFLVGFRSKLAVLLHWFYSYINYKRGARIITGQQSQDNA